MIPELPRVETPATVDKLGLKPIACRGGNPE